LTFSYGFYRKLFYLRKPVYYCSVWLF
jgi:hypothetical protein